MRCARNQVRTRKGGSSPSNAPVHARALALAIPATDNDQVKRVAAALALQVVLMSVKSETGRRTS